MKYFTKSEWMILVGLFVLSFIPVSAGIFRLVELGGGAAMLPENPRVTAAPMPVVLHIIIVGLYCYLGAFQFLPSIRRHSPKWHRCNGRLMVVSGIVSALSGLWMTHFYSFPYELQGDLLYCVRILLGSAMVVFRVLGLAAILRRDIVRHSSWMIRLCHRPRGVHPGAIAHAWVYDWRRTEWPRQRRIDDIRLDNKYCRR